MVTVIESIATNVQGLLKNFSKRSESVVGIDIGSSSIKVVQLKKEGGKVVLQTYGEVATGPYVQAKAGEIPHMPTEMLVKAVQEVLKESNVNTKDAALSIQSSASLLFVLNMPHLNEKDVSTVVPNEARKYIPVPLTEVSLDWWLIPKQEYIESADPTKVKTEVLVAAVRNETLEQYREIAKEAAISASLFEIEIFSAIRSSFHHELTPVMLVDMGASSTRVAVVEYGVVKKFHTINRGAHYLSLSVSKSLEMPFQEAEKIKHETGIAGNTNGAAQEVINTGLGYIFSEINEVLLQYEKEQHKTVGKIILIGGGAKLKGLHDRAKEEFTAEVVFGNPFQKTKSPSFLEGVLSESGPEFAIAVGLALKKLQ